MRGKCCEYVETAEAACLYAAIIGPSELAEQHALAVEFLEQREELARPERFELPTF